MTQATSSAEFKQLYRYADTAALLDANLCEQARSLRGALEHFEATCRESGFRLLVAHVAEWMAQHGAAAKVIDDWVHIVGQGFQLADSSAFREFVPPWLPAWMPQARLLTQGFALGCDDSGVHVNWSQLPFGVATYFEYLPAWLFPAAWWLRDRGNGLTGTGATGEAVPPTKVSISTPLAQASETPKSNVFLQEKLEKEVETDTDLLDNTLRYDIQNGQPVVERAYFAGKIQKIITVRDHIAAFGCLMTCFTMLLRDAGSPVRLTDLYRANYDKQDPSLKGQSNIDLDLALEEDGDTSKRDIKLYNLDLAAGAVGQASNNAFQSRKVEDIIPQTDPAAIEAKVKELLANGPFIMHVKTSSSDGHWIIVDAYRGSNKFSIRDPLLGENAAAEIPSSKYKPSGDVYFLTKSTAK